MPPCKGCKFFDHFPVIPCFKLKAVSPEIKHPWLTGRHFFYKFSHQGHQLRIVVMTGCLQPEPVCGNIERMAGNSRSAVYQTGFLQTFHHSIIAGAKWIRHSAHNGPEGIFQILPVFQQFPHCHALRQLLQKRMRQSMYRYFMPAVCIHFFHLPDRQLTMKFLRRIHGSLRCESSAVQIKSTLQTVLVHDPNQPDVLFCTIIIAQCERLCPSFRKTHKHS